MIGILMTHIEVVNLQLTSRDQHLWTFKRLSKCLLIRECNVELWGRWWEFILFICCHYHIDWVSNVLIGCTFKASASYKVFHCQTVQHSDKPLPSSRPDKTLCWFLISFIIESQFNQILNDLDFCYFFYLSS